jgi:hypothetical protein
LAEQRRGKESICRSREVVESLLDGWPAGRSTIGLGGDELEALQAMGGGGLGPIETSSNGRSSGEGSETFELLQDLPDVGRGVLKQGLLTCLRGFHEKWVWHLL